jgi:hypothetical protein
MLINTINPYWWMAEPVVTAQAALPRVDVGGIYKLSTNAVSLTDTTVDYGINPCAYRRLPNESLVLLTIHADVPTGGDNLPVMLVVPNSGTSTVSENNSTTGTSKLNIVDSEDTNVTGANVQGNTQRFVYINKCTGKVRFMEFTNAAAAATT